MALVHHIETLTDILRREIRSFSTVQELLMLEEKSLVECDTASLALVLEKMEDLFSSIACLEKSRMDVLERIADETGDDPVTMTITQLSDYVDGQLKKELLETGHILSQLNKDIQRKKISNTMLINQSIMLVESDIRTILNALNRVDDHDRRYNPKTGSGTSSHGVCIDHRI